MQTTECTLIDLPNENNINNGYFTSFVDEIRKSNKLIVQPRMGFGTVEEMQSGLKKVKYACAPTIGTLTIDSYTRVNQYDAAKRALDSGHKLNGFPIVTHGSETTRSMLDGLMTKYFPVQVRHGTALPKEIFKALLNSGLDATEGGPISYCLPYSRVPLEKATQAWAECSQLFAEATAQGRLCHLESFAGCMLGQLCPPSLLIALTVLECLFFRSHGVKSVSLSLAQGTNSKQDLAALLVLRRLAKEYLNDVNWHVVVYTYMGVFPETTKGAFDILSESARIAALSGCERLIVKTPAEAHRIPTIDENVASLEMAFVVSQDARTQAFSIDQEEQEKLYEEANFLIEMVMGLHTNLDVALNIAFKKGYLDVPYCLHQDNANLSRCYIDTQGYLKWASIGKIPFPDYLSDNKHQSHQVSSQELLNMLQFNKNKYDGEGYDN
ncbi:MAG: hypothetical protein O7D30_09495 [Rickettsia endosymbiont of Ixodes persulcatus]|nr:hypothetical protein [Rickettsia endosymbiont of Ixodes persulcatus]